MNFWAISSASDRFDNHDAAYSDNSESRSTVDYPVTSHNEVLALQQMFDDIPIISGFGNECPRSAGIAHHFSKNGFRQSDRLNTIEEHHPRISAPSPNFDSKAPSLLPAAQSFYMCLNDHTDLAEYLIKIKKNLVSTLASKRGGYNDINQLTNDFRADTGLYPHCVAHDFGYATFESFIISDMMKSIVEIGYVDGKTVYLPRKCDKFSHVVNEIDNSHLKITEKEQRKEQEKLARAMLPKNQATLLEGRFILVEIAHQLGAGCESNPVSWQAVQGKYKEMYGTDLTGAELKKFFQRDKASRILETYCDDEFETFAVPSQPGAIYLKFRRPYEECIEELNQIKRQLLEAQKRQVKIASSNYNRNRLNADNRTQSQNKNANLTFVPMFPRIDPSLAREVFREQSDREDNPAGSQIGAGSLPAPPTVTVPIREKFQLPPAPSLHLNHNEKGLPAATSWSSAFNHQQKNGGPNGIEWDVGPAAQLPNFDPISSATMTTITTDRREPLSKNDRVVVDTPSEQQQRTRITSSTGGSASGSFDAGASSSSSASSPVGTTSINNNDYKNSSAVGTVVGRGRWVNNGVSNSNLAAGVFHVNHDSVGSCGATAARPASNVRGGADDGELATGPSRSLFAPSTNINRSDIAAWPGQQNVDRSAHGIFNKKSFTGEWPSNGWSGGQIISSAALTTNNKTTSKQQPKLTSRVAGASYTDSEDDSDDW